MKLLVRIRERIKIIYITIVFVSVLVGFIIAAHVIWALARGVGAFHSNRQNSYMGAYLGVGACPGHYGNFMAYKMCKNCNPDKYTC